jgi:putative nucleotidyltransferase with HDIG domain
MLLGIAGGSLSALLRLDVGYVMGIGLLGFLILARANMSHAQALAQAQLQTLQLAAQALDARDAYTESHSERVAELAVALGKEMGLGHRTIDALRTAGSLHDIGKIGIRDHILNKAGPLTPDEWVVMRSHAARGAEMIQKHSQLAPVAPMVRSHHERYDGSGYPDGLVGLEIPLGARILAVADSFDTMTGPRIYRPSTKTPVEAIDEISTLAEKYYDPEVAAALRRIYGRYDPDPTAPSSSLQLVLSHSPFRRFLFGSAISSLGDPMTTVATLVTIYAHTKQPLMVAAAYGCKSIASLAVTSLVGAGADRAERRQLILALESARAVLLVVTPISLVLGLWVIFPLLFLLGAVNAIVQPARQAAIPQLVEPERVGQANALASAVTTAAAFVGFPLAGLVLAWTRSTDLLFIVDGVTFLVAGITVVGLGRLGGGVRGRHLWSAFRTAWTVRPARGHLVIASTSSVFIGLTFPVLIALAYELSSQGAQAYTLLEACLAGGIIVGSLLISRRSHIGTLDGVLMGLGVMGVFSIGVALSPWLWTTALLVFAASVGNPVYAIANQTAIIRAGEASNHGSLMATRFAWTQPAALVGTAVGGVIASWSNARVAYAVVGVGLLFLSMAAGLVVWRQDAELDLLRATGQDARRRSSEHKPAEMQGDIHTPNANGDSQSGATRDKDRVPISTG